MRKKGPSHFRTVICRGVIKFQHKVEALLMGFLCQVNFVAICFSLILKSLLEEQGEEKEEIQYQSFQSLDEFSLYWLSIFLCL